MESLYTLAYQRLSDFECNKCGKETDPGQPKLSSSDNEEVDLEAYHSCPNCSTRYQIEITDKDESIEITIDRLDNGETRKITSSKRGLRVDIHNVRDTLDHLSQLRSCLYMLRFNRSNFIYLTENIPEYTKEDGFPGGVLQHPVFKAHLFRQYTTI